MTELLPYGNRQNPVADQFRDSAWMIKVMVSVLRQYFGSDERLNPSYSHFKWDRDNTVSRLVIDSADTLDFKDGNKFPRVLVDLEDQNLPQDVIGDRDNYDTELGQMVYTTRTDTFYSIQCWSVHKLEARTLAEEVATFIQSFRQPLSCTYGYHFLRPSKIAKPIKNKELSNDHWVSTALIAFQITNEWGLQAQELRATSLKLGLKFGDDGSY